MHGALPIVVLISKGRTVPTYHYRCKNCGYDFTIQRSITADPLTQCPQCKAEEIHQVYSAVPINFKGSGFYHTDKDKK